MLSSCWKLCSTPTNVDGTRMKNRIQQNGKDKQNVFPYSQVSCNDFPVLPLHDVFLYLQKKQRAREKTRIGYIDAAKNGNEKTNVDTRQMKIMLVLLLLLLFSIIFIFNGFHSFAVLVGTLPFLCNLTTNSL